MEGTSGCAYYRILSCDCQSAIGLMHRVVGVFKNCETKEWQKIARLKADSHIACRAHAVPLPCHALIHTCHAAPLPCSGSAVSLVKVRMVARNIRTASPTV